MRAGGRNADVMFAGKADKITAATPQFREIICNSVFEHISSSIFAKGLCSGRQLYGYFHIKTALFPQSRSLENFQQLCRFPRSASACSGWEGGQFRWELQAEKPPFHPVVRGLWVLGRVEDVGHSPQRNSKSAELCPQLAPLYLQPSVGATPSHVLPERSRHPRGISALGVLKASAPSTRDGRAAFR